jgi:hypothetical protein
MGNAKSYFEDDSKHTIFGPHVDNHTKNQSQATINQVRSSNLTFDSEIGSKKFKRYAT